MLIGKASEIPRNEAYIKYAAVTRDEGNAADGRFQAASGGGLCSQRGPWRNTLMC